jgi:hypothetical protein
MERERRRRRRRRRRVEEGLLSFLIYGHFLFQCCQF